MTYTASLFADELDRVLASTGDEGAVERVADWAYATKLKHRDLAPAVAGWLDQLGVMTMGPEFELSLAALRELVTAARTV